MFSSSPHTTKTSHKYWQWPAGTWECHFIWERTSTINTILPVWLVMFCWLSNQLIEILFKPSDATGQAVRETERQRNSNRKTTKPVPTEMGLVQSSIGGKNIFLSMTFRLEKNKQPLQTTSQPDSCLLIFWWHDCFTSVSEPQLHHHAVNTGASYLEIPSMIVACRSEW